MTYCIVALLPPNPTTKRAFRVNWVMNTQETLIAYPSQNNLVVREVRDTSKAYIYTDFMNKVTAVQFHPNGTIIAVGDDKGRVRLVIFTQETGTFEVKKDHNMLGGPVHSISFTDDG